jgi:hypothetical protein
MLEYLIEKKVKTMLQEACIDSVSTDVVVGIEDFLGNWGLDPTNYPRIVLFVDEADFNEQQIAPSAPNDKTYIAYVMLLCYNTDYNTVMEQRSTITGRIIAVLKADKRLSSLADNITSEKVWDSSVERVRFAKTGTTDSFQASTMIEFIIKTSEL